MSYKRAIYKATRNKQIYEALTRAVANFRGNRARAFSKHPSIKNKAKRLKHVKEKALTNIEALIKTCKDAVEEVGGYFYLARNEEDAVKYVLEVVGTGKLVVKSKSLTCEEIGLNKALEEVGNTVVETDLGEFIIQQLNEKPMHILSPAIHIPKERVAKLFSHMAGREIPPKVEELVKFARKHLRGYLTRADVGVTGANAIAAETGTIFIVENEGNARFVSNTPPTHIVVAGLEKLLPTLEDCLLLVEVASVYAGYVAPSYVSMISGPSKTGDIEKLIVRGVHGPKELHVVLLDNGRSLMARDPTYRQALYCVKCGGCLYECPVYQLVGGYFGDRYFGGLGALWALYASRKPDIALSIAYTCTLCGRCVKHCPLEIDTPSIVAKVREELTKKGFTPEGVKKLLEELERDGYPKF